MTESCRPSVLFNWQYFVPSNFNKRIMKVPQIWSINGTFSNALANRIYFIDFAKQIVLLYMQKTLWPLFMNGVQLSQGYIYKVTAKRQFTFYHSIHKSSWNSFNRPRKDGRLRWIRSHPAVLNSRPQNWEYSVLTTRPLLHNLHILSKTFQELDYSSSNFENWNWI